MTDSKCVKNCATCARKYEEKCDTAGDASVVCISWKAFEKTGDEFTDLDFQKYQENLVFYDPLFDGCC